MTARRMPLRRSWPNWLRRTAACRSCRGRNCRRVGPVNPTRSTRPPRLPQGEWLCFVDADTFASAQALASVYAAAGKRNPPTCSASFTRQELGSFWEKVILPLVFTALSVGFAPRKVNDPPRPDAIANGQFIFHPAQSVYQALGGHTAIPGFHRRGPGPGPW